MTLVKAIPSVLGDLANFTTKRCARSFNCTLIEIVAFNFKLLLFTEVADVDGLGVRKKKKV